MENIKTGNDSSKRKKLALGRGLDALIPGLPSISEGGAEYRKSDIGAIRPNRYQPRIRFKEEELAELADSIREQGILQPLLVRTIEDGYELIAGERRLRAARLAGLTEVPVLVRDVSDAELLEMSIIENIQREDLNPMEEAEAYQSLMTVFGLTQEQVAARVGKSRSAVANFLRLHHLPLPVKASIVDGALSMGHARALLGAENSAQINAAWRCVIAKQLSVRETEALVRRMKAEKAKPEPPPPGPEKIYYASLTEELSRRFGTQVEIRRKGKKGKVEIAYYSDEDLDRLIQILKGE
jgi:ParB family transcriptional regulator, chromosome partitioning protein